MFKLIQRWALLFVLCYLLSEVTDPRPMHGVTVILIGIACSPLFSTKNN